MKRVKPVVGEIYHIYNRGVDKRKIFLDDFDYLRFVHDLYEFNDENPAQDTRAKSRYKECKEVRLPYIKSRERLVEILCWCLMDNHFHLMLREIKEGGITNFMRKLGSGYTNYFNLKNERAGSLFQGKYKSVLLESESHFLFLPTYIHLNPLDFSFPEWREGKIKDVIKAMKFLEVYRWSSFNDYIGKKNFPSVIEKKFLSEILGDGNTIKKEITRWMSTPPITGAPTEKAEIILE